MHVLDFKIDTVDGDKVLTLNNIPIAGTTNKSTDYYEGFIKGYSSAISKCRRSSYDTSITEEKGNFKRLFVIVTNDLHETTKTMYLARGKDKKFHWYNRDDFYSTFKGDPTQPLFTKRKDASAFLRNYNPPVRCRIIRLMVREEDLCK